MRSTGSRISEKFAAREKGRGLIGNLARKKHAVMIDRQADMIPRAIEACLGYGHGTVMLTIESRDKHAQAHWSGAGNNPHLALGANP